MSSHNLSTRRRPFWALLLALVFWAPPLACAQGDSSSAHLHSSAAASSDDAWGVKKVMAHFKTRSGIFQLSIVAMAVGLYILMRKFSDVPFTRPRK